ncbi:cysteine methyltransferase, partial [Xanthomonas perforans]
MQGDPHTHAHQLACLCDAHISPSNTARQRQPAC